MTFVVATPVLAQKAAPAAASPAAGEGSPDAELDAAERVVNADSALDEGIGLTLQDRIRAVSRKVFIKAGRFELTPMAGASVNDAFYRRWTVGGRASYHLFDSFSLDVGGAANVWSQELDPIIVVRQQLNAIPDVARLFGYADVGATFAPIYGKFALMSEYVVHFDAFISGGVGVTIDSNQYTFLGNQLPEWMPGVNPAAEIGVGARVFLLRWLVLRTDVRNYVYPQWRSGVALPQSLLMVNIGLGFYFPFDFEYQYSAAKVVDG